MDVEQDFQNRQVGASDVGDKTVLIVEDESDIRTALSLALEMEGYHVLTASNGRDALNVMSTSQIMPKLILLDLMMPVMNGWDFLKELRGFSKWGQIPVVIATAYADKANSIEAQGTLRKPIDLDALFDTVQKITRM